MSEAKLHTRLAEPIHDIEQVPQASPQPVEPPHAQHIAVADVVQRTG